MPSAMVLAPCACVLPVMALTMAGKREVCTPTISMRRGGSPAAAARDSSPRTAVAMPPISPPPPTAITSTSRSGCARSISSAIVPCPAITAGSSKGWMKTRPSRSASPSACSRAASKPSPCSTTSAPKPRVRSTLTMGVATGTRPR
jgi:hypothetical protein